MCTLKFAALRKKGHTLLGYIDDTLLIEDDAAQLDIALKNATKLFDDFGMTISIKKSILGPVQKIEYLGFVLNSVDMLIRLRLHKINYLFIVLFSIEF